MKRTQVGVFAWRGAGYGRRVYGNAAVLFGKLGLSRYLLGEVPPSGAGSFAPGGKGTKTPPKPKVSNFLFTHLAAKEMAIKR